MKWRFVHTIGVGIMCGLLALGIFVCTTTPVSPEAEVIEAPEDLDVAYWQAYIDAHGAPEAYQHFADLYGEYGSNQQHTFAHVFGEALYKEEDVAGVAVCDSRYGFGCYHSFFGWALLDHGLSILPQLDQACIAVHGEKGLGCQHGIGHGVIAELGYDHLQDSLEACMQLTWKGPIGGCTSGVLMEYNFATMNEGEVRVLDQDDLHAPCTEVSDQFLEACYFEEPAWWMAVYNQDPQIVGVRCSEAPTRAAYEACYWGLGNVLAGFSQYDIPYVKESCAKMPNAETEFMCIQGATWITGNQKEQQDVWKQLCDQYTGVQYEECVLSTEFI